MSEIERKYAESSEFRNTFYVENYDVKNVGILVPSFFVFCREAGKELGVRDFSVRR